MSRSTARERANEFCQRYGLTLPILEAPMAGSSSVPRAAAVVSAGGMGGFGAVQSTSAQITDWAEAFRAQSNGPFQINLWVPDPPPVRDAKVEAEMRAFLAKWGPSKVFGMEVDQRERLSDADAVAWFKANGYC